MRLPSKHLLVATLLAVSVVAVHASSVIQSKPVQFAKGATSATLQGSLKGDQTIDYKLRARAGQTMTVSLKTSNASNYFNVLPPGSQDVAIFVGSSDGNDWTGTLPADGEYAIRVYLMRSAARRNEVANYSLTVGITGSAVAKLDLGTPRANDVKVPGTQYHATTMVPCSFGSAPRGSSQCDAGVIRGNLGNGEVHITLPGGKTRVLTFIGDKVTADGGATVKSTKDGDTWLVDVNGDEHYTIYESLIVGG